MLYCSCSCHFSFPRYNYYTCCSPDIWRKAYWATDLMRLFKHVSEKLLCLYAPIELSPVGCSRLISIHKPLGLSTSHPGSSTGLFFDVEALSNVLLDEFKTAQRQTVRTSFTFLDFVHFSCCSQLTFPVVLHWKHSTEDLASCLWWPCLTA